MDSFMTAVNVVVPLCILIGIGYVTKETGMVSKDAYSQMNQIVFKLLIPVVLMKNIMETDLNTAFQMDLIIFAVGSILLLAAVLWIAADKLVPDRKRAGSVIQAIYRSNFVLFGLAVAGNMYGTGNVAVTTVLIAFCVPLYNILAVIVLQVHGMDHVELSSVIKGIFTNPMLIGTAIGFIVLILKLPVPEFLNSAIGDISKMATPLALLVLGGTFEFQSAAKNRRALFWITLCRLIIVPAVFIFAAVALGYRNVELVSLLVMFGSPTAVSSYPMAAAMKCDGDLAGQAVVSTTIFSVVSMIFWIFILTYMGLA